MPDDWNLVSALVLVGTGCTVLSLRRRPVWNGGLFVRSVAGSV